MLRADFLALLMKFPLVCQLLLDGPHAKDRLAVRASRFLIGLATFLAGWTQPSTVSFMRRGGGLPLVPRTYDQNRSLDGSASSWMRTMLPAGSRKAQSRTP